MRTGEPWCVRLRANRGLTSRFARRNCSFPVQAIEQPIEGLFPFLRGVVGALGDLPADALDQVVAHLRLGRAFAASGLAGGRWQGVSRPPRTLSRAGTIQTCGTMMEHRFIS